MYEIASKVMATQALTPTLMNSVLSVGRGGASLTIAASLMQEVINLRCGGITVNKKGNKLQTSSNDQRTTSSILGFQLTPEGKSVLYMAIAMSLHYFGYSLARPITVSLFTSATTGYKGSAAAFPFAMAFVSPVALVLLMGYTNILEKTGPRGALLASTFFCGLVINLAAIAIGVFEKTNFFIANIPAAKFISGPLFIFRESYVQLLTSQYWSFMASVLTPNQSARWFAPIAGLTSITSAVAGLTVSPLVDKIGLTGTLLGTGGMLLLSMLAASKAYSVANEYGFEPKELKKKSAMPKGRRGKKSLEIEIHKLGMVGKATRLFQRVPILWALFMEILASQGLATVLNICFVSRLGTAIPDDSKRAGWVGVFFSVINLITMVLQFGILPPLMTIIEPKDLWRVLPIVTILFTSFQGFQKEPSLYLVASSLMAMKVSEYSARRMLDEMIFVPLDFESRFVGKEVIGVFGYRFGKSLMSLGLSAITSLDSNFGLQKLSIFSNLVAIAWLRTAWNLSNMVPTRAEAEAAYKKGKLNK